jgi:hypothetical protein
MKFSKRVWSTVGAGAAAALVAGGLSFALTTTGDTKTVEIWADPSDAKSIISAGEQLVAAGAEEQGRALQDGAVDETEYRESFERLRSCVEEAGPRVTDAVISPLNGSTLEFAYDSGSLSTSTAMAIYDSCEGEHWQPLASLYEAVAPSAIEPKLADAIAKCVEASNAVAPKDRSDFEGFFEAGNGGENQQEAVASCAMEETWALYPSMPSVTVVTPELAE